MENQFVKYLNIRQPSRYKNYYQVQKIPNHWKHGSGFYTIHKCGDELTEELKILFPDLVDKSTHYTRIDNLLCNYQCIYRGVPIHKDDRDFAFNYIINTGGNNVETVWYDDNYKEIHRECIEPNKWHQLKVNVLHTVEGITNKRFGITITESIDNPFLEN